MIEVIKRGINPEEVSKECTCWKCQSVLRYKKADMKVYSDIRDSREYYKYITCPVCSATIRESVRPQVVTEYPDAWTERDMGR